MTVAFGMMGADPTVADAKYVLSWILRGTQTDFTRRDAWLEMRRHFTGVNDLEAALTLLVQYNYIREAPPKPVTPGRPGRRATKTYETNPLTFAQNTQITQNPPAPANFEHFEVFENASDSPEVVLL